MAKTDASGRLEQQDVERFNELYGRHYDAIFGYLRHRLGNREDALDVAATTFLSVWRHLERVPEEPRVRAWLVLVARGCAANHDRSNFRLTRLIISLGRERHSSEVLLELPGKQSLDEGSPITKALLALPPGSREALRLVVLEGVPRTVAASILGCSRAALDNRLSRARSALREAYVAAAPAGPGRASARTRRRQLNEAAALGSTTVPSANEDATFQKHLSNPPR